MTFRKSLRIALATLFAFAAMTELAHAGPLVAALGTAFTAISAAAKAIPLLSAVLSFGAQSLLAKFLAPAAPKQKGIKDKIQSGGDNPLSFIMGQCATAGKLVYVNQGGNNLNNMLTMVISLSELPVTALSNIIWINGEQCEIDFGGSIPEPDAPGPGFNPVTDYDKIGNDKYDHQYAWVKFYDGTQTVADEYLTDTFGSDPDKPWTSDMIGRGCAYAIVVCRYSAKGIWSGIPEFKFVVKGIPLYDISKDSSMGGSGAQRWNTPSTWAWSENPVVMKYNIIMGIRYGSDWLFGGQDTSQYQLPASYWLAAIAHCNETVHKDATDEDLKRYTAACEVTVDQQPIDIIKELDKTCAGYTTEYGGVWKTWSGAPGTSVFSFTDDDIVITEEQSDELFKTDTYCGVRATYTKPQEGWVSKECAPLIFDDFVTEDDSIQQIAELQLPFVTESNQVQRLMRLLVQDSRRQITHTLQLPPAAYILEPFDVVSWTSTRNGYSGKKFQVVAIDDLPNCNQQVSLREIDPTDYDWDTGFELPDPVGPIKPVKPGALALDFTVSPDQVDRPGGGKDKPAILIEWNWGLPDVDLKWVKYEVRRSSGQPKVVAHGTFHNTEDSSRTITSAAFRFGQDFQVRLFAQPERSWRDSNWTDWKDVTLVIVDVPSAPTLTRVSDLADDGTLDFFVDVDWTAVAAEVTYSVRVVSGASTRYYKAEENSLRFPATSGKTYVVAVRAIGADGGTKGDWSSTASITVTKKNTAPTTPAGLTATGDNHRIKLAWTKSPDSDFKRTIIYRSSTNDFTAASEVGRTGSTRWIDDNLANAVTRYYWITHEDRSGNESAKYPTSSTAGVSGTTVRVVDDDTDATALAAPTGLSLTQASIDIDDDGKADIALAATWTDIGATAKRYEVELSQSDTAGGSYTVVDTKAAKNNVISFKAKSTKYFKARVRAFSFNGTPGAWSSLTSAVKPNKKSATVIAPTTLSVAGGSKRNKLSWSVSTEPDYKFTKIYRSANTTWASATLLDQVKGTAFIDDNLIGGTSYYYYVSHVDMSGNESTVWPVSSGSGVLGTPGTLTTADLAAGSVTDAITDPTAPGTPTAVTLTQRTNIDEDGKAVLELKATWTAPAGISAKAGYEVNFNDGTDSWNVKSDDLVVRYPVRSNVLYTVKVRAVSFNGVKGSYSTAATITPSKKATAPTTAAGLAAAANHKRVKLTWTLCPDNDYKQTRVYRNTVNTFGTASIIGHVKGSTYLDDDIASNTTYFYWVAHVDQSGNVGTASSSATDTTPYILDGDTDPTALGAPTGLALSQASKDVDEDGKVDIAITATWSALTGAKSYELEITEAGTLIDNLRAANLKKTFKAKSNKLYSIRIRALSFNGTPGAWSPAVTLTPSKKSAAPTTASGLSVTPKPKGMFLEWTECTDADYRTTIIKRGGVEIARHKGDSYTDHEELTVGASYTYTIQHVDTSGNVGTASSGVAGTYRQAQTDDVEDDAITPSKARRISDKNNMFPDPDCLDLGVFVASGGTLTSHLLGAGSGAEGDAYVYLPAASASLGIGNNERHCSVRANRKYYFAATYGSLAASPSATYVLYAQWFSYSPSTDVSTLVLNSVIDTFTGIGQHTGELVITAPATANRVKLLAVKNSGVTQDLLMFSPIIVKASSREKIPDGDIDDSATDQTALSAPTGLSLSQAAKDVDEDGKVDIAITATWSALTGAKSYELEVTEAGTIIDNLKASALKKSLKAKSNKLYSIRIRGLSFNGTPGSWSSAVTLTPSKKSATPSAPTGFTSTPKPKAFKWDWTQVADADNRRYEVYVNTANNQTGGVGIVRAGNGDHFVYGDELTVGTAYYAFIRSVDSSGNVSAWVAASNNPQTYKAAATTDIGANQVTEALTGATISTATAPSVTQVAKDVNGDGVVDMALKLTGALPSGATSLEFEVDFDAAGSHDLQYFRAKGLTTRVGPVIAGKLYSVKVRGIAFNEAAGALSSATTITPTAKTSGPSDPTTVSVTSTNLGFSITSAPSPDLDYDHSEAYLSISTTAPTALSPPSLTYIGNGTMLNTAVGFARYLWIRHVNRSGKASNWVAYGAPTAVSALALDGLAISDDTVAISKIDHTSWAIGGVNTTAFLKNTTGGTMLGGTTTAGSNLQYCDTSLATSGTSPSGTWLALCRITSGQAGLFVRTV